MPNHNENSFFHLNLSSIINSILVKLEIFANLISIKIQSILLCMLKKKSKKRLFSLLLPLPSIPRQQFDVRQTEKETIGRIDEKARVNHVTHSGLV
jgi:hypothetical protein